MQRQYSFIYTKLVLGNDDFVGQIAYSIYKQEKIAFIERYKKEHLNREPVDVDFSHFHDFSSTESAIQSYRLKAELILQEFLNNSLGEAIEEVTDEIRKNQHELLKNIIKPIKPPGFWTVVWQNTLATFIFSAILALVILIIAVSTEGFWETMGKLFNKDIRPKTEKLINGSV